MSWSSDVGDAAVGALQELERRGMLGSIASVRHFKSLQMPVYRRRLAEAMSSGSIKNTVGLDKCIASLRHEQAVSWHWREDNPNLEASKGVFTHSLLERGILRGHLPREGRINFLHLISHCHHYSVTVTDDMAKRAFAASVPTPALTFNAGGWVYTSRRPLPPIDAVHKAKLYTDEAYAQYRDQMLSKKFNVQRVEVGEDELMVLTVQGHSESPSTVRIYNPSRVKAVPNSLASVPVKVVFLQARQLTAPAEHVLAAAASGAVVAVWGGSGDVNYVTNRITAATPGLRSTDINVYVRGDLRLPPGVTASSLLLRVLGHPAHFVQRVCMLSLLGKGNPSRTFASRRNGSVYVHSCRPTLLLTGGRWGPVAACRRRC